jgi:hypothetical protein
VRSKNWRSKRGKKERLEAKRGKKERLEGKEGKTRSRRMRSRGWWKQRRSGIWSRRRKGTRRRVDVAKEVWNKKSKEEEI